MTKKKKSKTKKSRKVRRPSKASPEKWERGANPKSSGNTFKPKPGTNYVKLVVSDFSEAYIHWLDDSKGNRVRLVCQDDPEERNNSCQICKAAMDDDSIDTSHKYYFAVVIGSPKTVGGKKMIIFKPTVQIMEVGPKIGTVICSMGKEIERDVDGEWEEQKINDITQVVFKIIRKGENIGTQYETRVARVKFKVNGDVSDFPDLESFTKPATDKEINNSLGTGIDEDEEDDDEFGDDEFDEDEDDDDDGDEFDEEEEDDDDDEDDEEDESEDDEEEWDVELEDEEEEPKPKKKAKTVKKSKKSKKSKKR